MIDRRRRRVSRRRTQREGCQGACGCGWIIAGAPCERKGKVAQGLVAAAATQAAPARRFEKLGYNDGGMPPRDTPILAPADIKPFRRPLLRWYDRHARRFSWRETHDPYQILLAEVLLQRTQAPQVEANYAGVLAALPTPEALGRAQLAQVREALKPLGLAKRAPTLWEMGSHLSDRFAGRVPLAVADLMSLPGVGRYIASATACFAGGVRIPVVDTNVIRIMSRYFGIESERSRPRVTCPHERYHTLC